MPFITEYQSNFAWQYLRLRAALHHSGRYPSLRANLPKLKITVTRDEAPNDNLEICFRACGRVH